MKLYRIQLRLIRGAGSDSDVIAGGDRGFCSRLSFRSICPRQLDALCFVFFVVFIF
jgi:hypothetical protein